MDQSLDVVLAFEITVDFNHELTVVLELPARHSLSRESAVVYNDWYVLEKGLPFDHELVHLLHQPWSYLLTGGKKHEKKRPQKERRATL